MLRYVKISYNTKEKNEALRQCIIHIGKYYGRNEEDLYKSGRNYLARKVRGATTTSINRMVYPKKIKNSEMKEWNFKKKAYRRTYSHIIELMLKNTNESEKAFDLLHNLYLEAYKENISLEKILSNILILEQKNALDFARDKKQYEYAREEIKAIRETCDKCDEVYSCILSNRRLK